MVDKFAQSKEFAETWKAVADRAPAQVAEKIRENRLRRMAERQRFRLVKSRRRDPNAFDYGTYMLVDIDTNGVVMGSPITGKNGSASLDDVEDYLTGSGAWARD